MIRMSKEIDSVVAKQFYGEQNIQYLQDEMLRRAQPHVVGHKLHRQNVGNLKLIMYHIYNEYVEHGTVNAVEKLNVRVLDICVKQIISGAKAYLNYVRDASRLPQPIDHPKYMSVHGTKNA